MRLRAFVFLVGLTFVVYRLLPKRQKEAVRDRFKSLGQALVISIVIYWIWLLATFAVGALRD